MHFPMHLSEINDFYEQLKIIFITNGILPKFQGF